MEFSLFEIPYNPVQDRNSHMGGLSLNSLLNLCFQVTPWLYCIRISEDKAS